MSDQIKPKCCDNDLCEDWHGVAGKLWVGTDEGKAKSGEVDTSVYNQVMLRTTTITVCRKCERMVDIFFGLWKHVMHKQ